MEKQTLLHLEQVTRTYEQGEHIVHALDQVSLHVKKGEFLALAGPSGSGKTTLLNIAAGLDQPSEGKAFFLEKDLGLMSRRKLAKLRLARIGFVFQSHFKSPPAGVSSGLAISKSRYFLPLQFDIADHEDYFSEARLDRFNLSFDLGKSKVTIGRQPVTWGEGYFWPALDLFSPFSPEQLDRDYKSGVDSVKINMPLGNLSELEVIGGILGSSLERDGTLGALLRWNLGNVDVGFMGGSFHQDSVGGLFLSADVRGTGVRAEVTYTSSGDKYDRLLDREDFWRGSVGITRQLTPTISVTSELAFNGYGADDSENYALWYLSDRMSRGEVNGYGKYYWGTSLTQQFHPLLIGTLTSLVNFTDNSVLLTPSVIWSLSDNSDVIIGGELGIGDGIRVVNEIPVLGSEYGSVPATVFLALKVYF